MVNRCDALVDIVARVATVALPGTASLVVDIFVAHVRNRKTSSVPGRMYTFLETF